jgi:hypothetical protein
VQRARPPPWSVEETDAKLRRLCFIVRDANGQASLFEAGAQNDRRAGELSHRSHLPVAGNSVETRRQYD